MVWSDEMAILSLIRNVAGPFTFPLFVANSKIIWRPCNKSLSDKLESVQKRAIKWILFEEGRSYPPEQYVKKCKLVDILPLSQKFDLNDLILAVAKSYTLNLRR